MSDEFKDSDFDKADEEASELTRINYNTDVSDKSVKALKDDTPKDMMEYREQLLREHHGGAKSLAERLDKDGRNHAETLVMGLVEEIVKETDELKANEMVVIREGNLRDASIISSKRADVLEKAIKAVQTKQLFEKENGLDISSPSMEVVFNFFMTKVKVVFTNLKYDDEASDIFFNTLGNVMENWRKELQEELNSLHSLKE